MPTPLNLADFNSFSPAQQSAWILSMPEYVNVKEGTVCHNGSNLVIKFERNLDTTIKPTSVTKMHAHRG